MLAVVPPTGSYTKAEQAHLFERECVCLLSGGRRSAAKGPHTYWQGRNVQWQPLNLTIVKPFAGSGSFAPAAPRKAGRVCAARLP
jgi:hypothetical protein